MPAISNCFSNVHSQVFVLIPLLTVCHSPVRSNQTKDVPVRFENHTCPSSFSPAITKSLSSSIFLNIVTMEMSVFLVRNSFKDELQSSA